LKKDDLCGMNIWALYPETINLVDAEVKLFKGQHKEDRKIECLLPNVLSELLENERLKMKVYPAV